MKVELDSFNELQSVDGRRALWRSDVDLPVVRVTVWRHVWSQDCHVPQLEVDLQILSATHSNVIPRWLTATLSVIYGVAFPRERWLKTSISNKKRLLQPDKRTSRINTCK